MPNFFSYDAEVVYETTNGKAPLVSQRKVCFTLQKLYYIIYMFYVDYIIYVFYVDLWWHFGLSTAAKLFSNLIVSCRVKFQNVSHE